MSPETLDLFINENRLIRGSWTGENDQGRETACLLAALSPEVFKAQSANACPASLMPQWLARLTVFIDGHGTLEHWPVVVRRYANLASRWHVLTPVAWKRSMHRVNRASVLEAMLHTSAERSLAVCKAVVALLDRAIAGDPPTIAEWQAAREAAEEAATAKWAAKWAEAEAAAKWAAAAAAAAAKWAAEAEAAAKWAAKWGAETEAKWAEAKWAAEAAAKWAAVAAAAAAKWAAAADRMIDAWLDILESEIIIAEKAA